MVGDAKVSQNTWVAMVGDASETRKCRKIRGSLPSETRTCRKTRGSRSFLLSSLQFADFQEIHALEKVAPAIKVIVWD